MPSNMQIADMYLFNHEFERKFSLSKLIILKYFLTDSNGAFVNYKELTDQVKEKNSFYKISIFKLGLLFFKALLKGKIVFHYSPSVWFTDHWSGGYFHWMLDALPRLLESGVKGETKIFLPLHFANLPYVMPSLKAMGYCNVSFMQANKYYLFKHLIFNTHSAPTGNYNEKTVRQLREIFFSQLKDDSINVGERIFVSRSNAERRKIINETDLHAILNRFGFSILHFEDYSWHQQVDICSKAKYLFGLHGAGLSNMLFLPEKSVVLELRKVGDSHNNCYFSLASALGHSYYYLQCKTNSEEILNSDFYVDIREFQQLFEIIFSADNLSQAE